MNFSLSILTASASLFVLSFGQSAWANESEAAIEPTDVLMMTPNAEVVFITTGGAEPRADWSQSANDNFSTHFATQLEAKGLSIAYFDPELDGSDELEQVLALQEVVNDAMFVVPPHKVEASRAVKKAGGDHQAELFEGLTLGNEASLLKDIYGSEHALFVDHYSQIESGGVFLMQVAIGAATGYVPPSQNIRFSRGTVFDLETGDVVDTQTHFFGDPRDVGESSNIVTKIVSELSIDD